MKYDPIKNSIGDVVGDSVVLRKVFYAMLGFFFLRTWHVKRELRRIFGSGTIRTMFDAGSGFGQYSYYCARKFPNVSIYAADVKEEQIRDCTGFFHKAGIPSVKFGTEDLLVPKHQNEFDLVLSVDVMEHIIDDVTVFRNFCNSLKPGGVLLVNTPSNLSGSDAREEEAGFIEEHARTGYGNEEIRAKLDQAGFSVENISYTYGFWGMVSWRLGIKVPMMMLNWSKAFFLFLPFYYLVTLLFVVPLMAVDYFFPPRKGAGLLVIARRPA